RVGRRLRLVGLGGALVALGAVVGLVEARALEEDRGAGAEEAAQLRLLALGAFLERLLREALELLELVAARVAPGVVGGHGYGLCLYSMFSARVAIRNTAFRPPSWDPSIPNPSKKSRCYPIGVRDLGKRHGPGPCNGDNRWLAAGGPEEGTPVRADK